MKMTLNLTNDEAIKIVEDMRTLALSNGWDYEDIERYGILEDYSKAIDVFLNALNIELRIGSSPTEDEDEDELPFDEDEDEDFNEDNFDDNENDEDEDAEYDDSCQYSLTVKGEFVLRYMEAGYPFEEACEVADLLFGNGE